MLNATSAYAALNKNMRLTLERVGRQGDIKRDAEYYRTHINKVKDLDAFMADYRLYSYALTSVGLGDLVSSRALIRKVLESDLSDQNSFANRMNDPRYKELAAAFNFGKQKPDAQEDELIGLYRASFGKEAKEAEKQTEKAEKKLADVRTVGDIVDDVGMRNYLLKAFGIDGRYVTADFLRKILTSDPADPNSFVNKEGDERHKAMVAAIAFDADGKIKGGQLSSSAIRTITDNYLIASRGKVIDFADPYRRDIYYTSYAVAERNRDYFQAKIASIKSADELVADKRLRDVVVAAYKLDPDISDAALKRALTTRSYAASLGAAQLYDDFNFDSDGKIRGRQPSQNSANVAALSARTKEVSDAWVKFSEKIDKVDDIFADKTMVRLLKQAYQLPLETSDEDLRKILTDETFAQTYKTKAEGAAKALNLVFNFDKDGNRRLPNGKSERMAAQDPLQRADTVSKISGLAGRLQQLAGTVGDADALLADKDANALIRTLFSVADTVSDADLKKALTDASYAASAGLKALYDCFSFQPDGKTGGLYAPQTTAQVNAMVEKAGAVANSAVFRMGQMSSVDQMLADKDAVALLRAAFDLPRSMSDAELKTLLTDRNAADAKGLGTLNALFNFSPDGTVRSGEKAMSTVQKNRLLGLVDDARANFLSQTSKTANAAAMIADSRMNAYLRMTYGIGAEISDEDLKKALTDAAFAKDKGLSALNADFSFKPDGSAPASSGAQTAGGTRNTSDLYMARFKDAQDQNIEKAVKNYKTRMHDKYMKSLNDFLSSNRTARQSSTNLGNSDLPELYQMALRAYGLDEKDFTPSQFRRLITSDAYDAKSYVASLKDPRLIQMVRDFNFTADGKFGLGVEGPAGGDAGQIYGGLSRPSLCRLDEGLSGQRQCL